MNLADPAAALRARDALPRVAALADALANSRRGQARSREAVAARAVRPAGDQGDRRHVRREPARARDRGAGARRSRPRPRACAHAIVAVIGDNLASVRPARRRRRELKDALIAQGAWSQYLEVGIGPDAEIFTKAQPMSAVGIGADDRHPSEVGLEQSGARDRARGRQPRPRPSAPRSATTSTCAISRAAARCCSARRRTTTRRARSGRSSGCSTSTSASTTCAGASSRMRVDGPGRLRARRRELDAR